MNNFHSSFLKVFESHARYVSEIFKIVVEQYKMLGNTIAMYMHSVVWPASDCRILFKTLIQAAALLKSFVNALSYSG